MIKSKEVKMDREYEVQDARRTLERAEKIKSDKGLMREVKKAHEREANVIKRATTPTKSKAKK